MWGELVLDFTRSHIQQAAVAAAFVIHQWSSKRKDDGLKSSGMTSK